MRLELRYQFKKYYEGKPVCGKSSNFRFEKDVILEDCIVDLNMMTKIPLDSLNDQSNQPTIKVRRSHDNKNRLRPSLMMHESRYTDVFNFQKIAP